MGPHQESINQVESREIQGRGRESDYNAFFCAVVTLHTMSVSLEVPMQTIFSCVVDSKQVFEVNGFQYFFLPPSLHMSQ